MPTILWKRLIRVLLRCAVVYKAVQSQVVLTFQSVDKSLTDNSSNGIDQRFYLEFAFFFVILNLAYLESVKRLTNAYSLLRGVNVTNFLSFNTWIFPELINGVSTNSNYDYTFNSCHSLADYQDFFYPVSSKVKQKRRETLHQAGN